MQRAVARSFLAQRRRQRFGIPEHQSCYASSTILLSNVTGVLPPLYLNATTYHHDFTPHALHRSSRKMPKRHGTTQNLQQPCRYMITSRQKRAGNGKTGVKAEMDTSSKSGDNDADVANTSSIKRESRDADASESSKILKHKEQKEIRNQQNQQLEPQVVSIDYKSMYDPSIHLPDKPDFVIGGESTGVKNAKTTVFDEEKFEPATPLSDVLTQIIALSGPIPFAEYMRQALTHPDYGYYTTFATRQQNDDDVNQDDDWDSLDALSSSSSNDKEDDMIIGKAGDFTTAPEISQLFGESVLIWLLTRWQADGMPSKGTSLVEAGPGRGTLMADILRAAASSFPAFMDALCDDPNGGEGSRRGGGIHLVETDSTYMRNLQKQAIVDALRHSPYHVQVVDRFSGSSSGQNKVEKGDQHETTPTQVYPSRIQGVLRVHWHESLSTVPRNIELGGPQYIVAQEYLDALPVHSFQKMKDGSWKERMVDVEALRSQDDEEDDQSVLEDDKKDKSLDQQKEETQDISTNEASTKSQVKKQKKPRLRMVLAPRATPALQTFLRTDKDGFLKHAETAQQDDAEPGDILEVCPEGLSFVQDVALRLGGGNHQNEAGGGAALIVDYGSGTGTGDSVRAFRRHEQVPVLSMPGNVDVTADVDFGALVKAVQRLVADSRSSLAYASSSVPPSSTSQSSSVLLDPSGSKIPPSITNIPEKKLEVQAHGPITQQAFLGAMGAVERATQLANDPSTTEKQAEDLITGLERLMSPELMGERYKVMCIVSTGGSEAEEEELVPPAGFEHV